MSAQPEPSQRAENDYDVIIEESELVKRRKNNFEDYITVSGITVGRPCNRSDADLFYRTFPGEWSSYHDFEYIYQEPFRIEFNRYGHDEECDSDPYIRRTAYELQQETERYHDGLTYHLLEYSFLPDAVFEQHKNNLMASYKDFVFYACGSDLRILKNFKTFQTINTSPSENSIDHIRSAVNQESPHSINFMKFITLRKSPYLVLCHDNGTAQLYNLSKLEEEDGKVIFYLRIKLKKSVWGADAKENYLVLSDNSHKVTLLYFKDDSVYLETTQPLFHNITDVSIVTFDEKILYVACTSISGELTTFKFKKTENPDLPNNPFTPFSPSTEHIIDTTINNNIQSRYEFESEVANRLMLEDQGWSIHSIHSKHFRKVPSAVHLGRTGKLTDYDGIITKSKKLDLEYPYKSKYRLGGATKYETIHLQTRYSHEGFETLKSDYVGLNDFQDKVHRIKKDYVLHSYDVDSALNPYFYFVTTPARIGLFRANGLICNADTNEMLYTDYFELLVSSLLLRSNILSITAVIPDLSVYIAISQAGLITVFRMVQYEGLFSFREEFSHIFKCSPDSPPGIAFPERCLHLIVGCTVENVYDGVFWVYITGINGKVLRLEIKDSASEKLIVEFI